MRTALVGWLCACLVPFSPPALSAEASGTPEKMLSQLLFTQSVLLEEARQPYAAQVAALNENYISALNKAAAPQQAAGNLDNLLAIKTEIDSISETGSPGAAVYPGSDNLRSKYKAARDRIDVEEAQKVKVLLATQLRELEALRTMVAAAGDETVLDQVDRHIVRVLAELEKGANEERAFLPPAAMAREEVRDSPLYTGEKLTGKIELKPGVYKIPGRVHLGDPEAADKNGDLEVHSGTSFAELDLLIDEGRFTAENVLFSGSAIGIDLGGSFSATASIFDRCRLYKGGAWSVKYYSAKWQFRNCVFYRCFVDPIRPRANGLQIVECTVIDAEIPLSEYYETPVEESDHEQRQIERCLFIGCTIPESTLLMMEDCVFDRCTFIPDIDRVLPETRKRCTLYFPGSPSSLPPGNEKVEFVAETADRIRKQVGASVRYTRSGEGITFE